MKRYIGYFWRGCLVIAPVAITVYVAWMIIRTVDTLIPIGIPGVGFVVTVLLITLIGFLTSNVVGRTLVSELERALSKVPLVKLLYSSIRDLINAFVGERKRFDKPVAVRFGATGPRALGFVTRQNLPDASLSGMVAVYFPQSYNFAGNLLVVARDQVEPLDLNSVDVMTFIVSGGVSGLGVGQSMDSIPPPSGPLGPIKRGRSADATLLGVGMPGSDPSGKQS